MNSPNNENYSLGTLDLKKWKTLKGIGGGTWKSIEDCCFQMENTRISLHVIGNKPIQKDMANKKQSRAREELIRFLTRHEGMRFKHRGKDWLSMTRLYPILKQEEKRRTWLQMELYEFGSRKLREFPSDVFYFLQEVGGEVIC